MALPTKVLEQFVKFPFFISEEDPNACPWLLTIWICFRCVDICQNADDILQNLLAFRVVMAGPLLLTEIRQTFIGIRHG